MRRLAPLRLLSILGLIAGCNKSPTVTGSNLTVTELEVQVGLAHCRMSPKCGWLGASEEAGCEAGVKTRPPHWFGSSTYWYGDGVSAGRLTFDAAAAQACIDAYAGIRCSSDDRINTSRLCDSAFKAAVPVGGTCLSDVECIGGYCDMGDRYQAGCAGKCTAFLAIGDACEPNGQRCNGNDCCGPTGSCGASKTCAPRVAIGAACGAAQWCEPGVFCFGYKAAANGQPEVQGTCGINSGLGEPCQNSQPSGCKGDLACQQDNGRFVCSPFPQEGQPCDWWTGCEDGFACIGVGYDANHQITMGACARWLDIGDTCTDPDAGSTACPGRSRCDKGTRKCTRYGRLGDACTQWIDCDEGYGCDPSGKCSPTVSIGETCSPDWKNCSGGVCDPTTSVCTIQCK